MAPSAGNMKMWAFVVVTDAQQRRKIAALRCRPEA
ncbi:MAG: nitroreductase family protein [Gammaproteobacteria bacterium]|nr:nitroreductase family protein [Gammaproteobacteria bacterium]